MINENPFTITFGKRPNRLISRYEDSDKIISTFTADNPVSQTFLIEGIRGSGKTVLMTTVSKQLEDDKNWIVVNLNPTMDLLSNLAIRLADECDNKPQILSKGFNVSAAGFGIGVNPDGAMTDYVGSIEKSFKSIIKKKKRVLITIDEVVHDNNMKVFASQFQIFVRQDYPIFLLMTGLQNNISDIQNDPSLTFLLRAPKIITGALSTLQIRRQYQEIFDIDDNTAGELAGFTKGYAFGFQAFGVCYWENRDQGIDKVLAKFDELLDDYVYKKIWSDLTAKERDIVLAIQGEEEKVGVICSKANISNGTFSKYKEKMMAAVIIEATKYGYVSLILPRFYEVVRNYQV